MCVTYQKLIKEQWEEENNNYKKLLEYLKAFMTNPLPYPERTSLSVNARFKKISSVVMKFMDFESVTQMESGQNLKDYYQSCKTLFEHRFPSVGNFNDFCACKEYLETKPKWSWYSKTIQENDNNKHGSASAGRPTGNKKAKKRQKINS